MDDLDDREALLRGIFADPDSDLPRLVFADWLDERGEAAWAELIRVQCEVERMRGGQLLDGSTSPFRKRESELFFDLWPEFADRLEAPFPDRGFLPATVIAASAELLGDPVAFRRTAILDHPEWYGCTALKVVRGLIVGGKPIRTILTSPVTERVTELDLSGVVVTFGEPVEAADDSAFGLLREYEYRPAVTVQAVQALVDAREARRLTTLDLRNNDLDNDAARAIVHSPNLIRLKSLQLFDGNQLRGRTWQQLLERFGPDVLQ